MDSLVIQPTRSTPLVDFDLEQGIFKLSGISRPENVLEFYGVVVNWLDELVRQYQSNPSGTGLSSLELIFQLNYFNTSSSKFMLRIIRQVSNLQDAGLPVSFRWYFESGDEQMREDGEYLAEAAEIEFDYVEEEE